jgi:hypothetical protein
VTLPSPALDSLREARRVLEHPGLAVRLADLAGRPIEKAMELLPAAASERVALATRAALEKALGLALGTLDARAVVPPSDWAHRLGAVALGAAGGAFGLAALPVELPLSTAVMLRSIAEHARREGEDLASPRARLECLTVFALGGRAAGDDAAETGYFGARVVLSRLVGEAAEYVAVRGVQGAAGDAAAPALARLLARIAQRFAIPVSQKAAAQLVPAIGAAGGAAINAAFIHHYQRTAWGHFTVRRLEREHGEPAVRAAWEEAG